MNYNIDFSNLTFEQFQDLQQKQMGMFTGSPSKAKGSFGNGNGGNKKTVKKNASSSSAGPTPAQVGSSLITNLFPKPTAAAAKDFVHGLNPDPDAAYAICASGLHAVKVGARTENLGGWWDSLLEAGKTVAISAGKALLNQAVAYVNNQSQTSKLRDSNDTADSDVGKFADTLRLSVPILTQLSAAAVPPIPKNTANVSADPTTDAQKQIIATSVLSQIAQTVGNNFVAAAQNHLIRNSSAEKELTDINDVITNSAIGTISTLTNTVMNRVVKDPSGVTGVVSSPAASPTTAALATQATDSTTQHALVSSYTAYGKLVATRGAQALIATAKQLHTEQASKTDALFVEDDWWNTFCESANEAAKVVGFFSPSLQFNTNNSLANASDVQTSALTSGIQAAATAAAAVVGKTYPNHTGNRELDAQNLGSFWDTLTSIASTVGNVVSTVAPVAAKLLPLVL